MGRLHLSHILPCLLFVLLWPVGPAWGDGGFFIVEGQAAELAQTRQEVLLAIHGNTDGTGQQVTYVLRTYYNGDPGEFAWVIPVPTTPTDVIAHDSARLFDELRDLTEPTFQILISAGKSGWGCFYVSPQLTGNENGGLVEVEATGEAGIFNWVALTSAGSEALLTWLNDNGFNVPSEATAVLDSYINKGMHFLALRIRQPSEAQENGQIEIPPIQFTCQTTQRLYPMAISQISAAAATEVLIYVLADHRIQAANAPNGTISPEKVKYDASSPSYSNYESLFTQTLDELGPAALITEFANSLSTTTLDWMWQEAPAQTFTATFLTRMRTVMSPDQMNLDFEFQDASEDQTVSSQFWLDRDSGVSAAGMAGQPLAALLLFGLFRAVILRRGCIARAINAARKL